MKSRGGLVRWSGGGAWVAVLSLALRGDAADFVGPGKCTSCHDHERQARKWKTEEPAAFKGRAHVNALKLLDGAVAGKYAAAIGLKDAYDVKGECVRCHATVFRGDANAGVSCESCHGAASGYLELHQPKGSYAKAVAAGMRDLRSGPAPIAALCVGCHVVPDARLSRAGHPAGKDFDAGLVLDEIMHWTARYDAARVSAEGRARSGASAAKPPAAVSSTPPAAPVRPAAQPAAGAKRSAASTPWDWDQPVRPLPQDYVPEPVAERAPKPASAPVAPPAAAKPAPPPDPLPPSIAEDMPLAPLGGDISAAIALPAVKLEAPRPPAAKPAPEPRASGLPQSAVAKPTPAAPALTRSAAARAIELRGQAIQLLERLLRSGVRTPSLPPPQKPREYGGPDGELLRLQDEVLVLALEALRREKP